MMRLSNSDRAALNVMINDSRTTPRDRIAAIKLRASDDTPPALDREFYADLERMSDATLREELAEFGVDIVVIRDVDPAELEREIDKIMRDPPRLRRALDREARRTIPKRPLAKDRSEDKQRRTAD